MIAYEVTNIERHQQAFVNMTKYLYQKSRGSMTVKSYKGKFVPKNPKKYKGDPTNIIFRSLWERKFMDFLDTHDKIMSWNSEEVSIVYHSPVDGRLHRYFPDFWIKKLNSEGHEECAIIEIKPKKQTKPPKQPKRNTASYINEVKTYVINQAKFEAATNFCEQRQWQFLILTENELGIKTY